MSLRSIVVVEELAEGPDDRETDVRTSRSCLLGLLLSGTPIEPNSGESILRYSGFYLHPADLFPCLALLLPLANLCIACLRNTSVHTSTLAQPTQSFHSVECCLASSS